MSEQKLPMFCPSCGRLTEDLCPYCNKCFNCCGAHEGFIIKSVFEKLVRDEDRVRKI